MSAPLLAAAPASAASTPQSFDFSTQAGGTYAGWASAKGSISYYDRDSFVYKGTVTDHCPKDGAGAYFGYWIRYANGELVFSGWKHSDRSGCDDGTSTSFNVTVNVEAGRRIQEVQFELAECNLIDGGSYTSLKCGSTADDKSSTWKDNPYT